MATASLADRNRAIADAYRAGATLMCLADLHGVTPSRISQILKREGARLTGEALRQRCSRGGRQPLPLTGEERRQYVKLRWYLGATEAREAMGIGCAQAVDKRAVRHVELAP